MVTLSFDKELEEASKVGARIGDVNIETSPVTFNGVPDKRCLAIASIELECCPEVTREGLLVVPAEPRQKCEFAIEAQANLISVLARTGRRIASATPCVAFSEISKEEREVLGAARALSQKYRVASEAHEPISLKGSELPQKMGDRFAGLALMAEALANRHEVGRFRELMRFFEFAFARDISKIEKKLSQFLNGAGLGYSRSEVSSWLALRDGATHGDMQKTRVLITEPDVRELVPRIEQAAFDVLFNKKDWHSPSSERRQGQQHTVATTGASDGGLQITRGRAASLGFKITDPFGAYPMDLEAILTSPPEDWWWVEPASPHAT